VLLKVTASKRVFELSTQLKLITWKEGDLVEQEDTSTKTERALIMSPDFGGLEALTERTRTPLRLTQPFTFIEVLFCSESDDKNMLAPLATVTLPRGHVRRAYGKCGSTRWNALDDGVAAGLEDQGGTVAEVEATED